MTQLLATPDAALTDSEPFAHLHGAIAELEGIYEQARYEPGSPLWRQLLRRLNEVQEQLERFGSH